MTWDFKKGEVLSVWRTFAIDWRVWRVAPLLSLVESSMRVLEDKRRKGREYTAMPGSAWLFSLEGWAFSVLTKVGHAKCQRWLVPKQKSYRENHEWACGRHLEEWDGMEWDGMGCDYAPIEAVASAGHN